MLRQSSIEVKNAQGKISTVEVGEAVDAFNTFAKFGKDKVEMLTYNPLTKQFVYQMPVGVQPARGISKVMNIDIKVDDAICTVKVGSIARLLVMNNNLVTSMGIESLKNIHAIPVKVAFVTKNDKGEKVVDFKPIIKVYDYTFADKPKVEVKSEIQAKKRGRPKKALPLIIETSTSKEPEEYTLVKLDTRDGSLFVCDNLIMK